MKKLLIIAAFLGLSSSVLAGEKVVDFTLKSNQGNNIQMSDLRGQVVMLNFWASWCGPCVQEFPYLEQIHQRYKNAGFTLLGVNIDNTEEQAQSFLKDRDASFPIVFDPTLKVRNAYKKFEGMPLSIFIDCDGNIETIHRSYYAGDEKKYIKTIKGLIRKCSA